MITVRMPGRWRGKVSDRQPADWVQEYRRRLPRLPDDPGPGKFKRSFRLSNADRDVIKLFSRNDVSGFVRRLIALHLESLKPAASKPSPQIRAPSQVPQKQNLAPCLAPSSSTQKTSAPVVAKKAAAKSTPASVPKGMPPVLWQHTPENRWRPVFENSRWVRNPVTEEEKKAYAQWIESSTKLT